jgi:steroid 5-alpha reductase family enzyme
MQETLFINIVLFGIILFTLTTLIFLLSVWRRDMSIMDVAYGPLFALGAWGTMWLAETSTPLGILIALLITVWAARLGLRIGRKNWGKPEDARYAAWRVKWIKRGSQYFLLRSYLQVNLFQALIILIIATPFHLALSSGVIFATWHTMLGIAVTLFGLGYESLADWQLDRFLSHKRRGTITADIMTSGLFRYSRRPNYFGEVLVWVGLAVIAYPLPYGYIAAISPLLILYIVTRVTGPMLERVFLERYPEAYRVYMVKTSYFIPWLPKK